MKGILKGIGFFALYFVMTMLFQALISIVFIGIGAATGLRDKTSILNFANSNLLGMTTLSGVFVCAALFLIFKLRKMDIKKEWKLEKFKVNDIFIPIIVAFSYSFIYALITYDVASDNSLMIHSSVEFYSDIFPGLGLLFMVLNLLVIAPISEEIALRGIVYTRIEKTTNWVIAIAISSLLFGLMHLAAGGVLLVLGAIIMGAVFGMIFHKTKSLPICFIAHAMANFPDFILYSHPQLSNAMKLSLEAIFGVIFIFGILFLLKRKENKC